ICVMLLGICAGERSLRVAVTLMESMLTAGIDLGSCDQAEDAIKMALRIKRTKFTRYWVRLGGVKVVMHRAYAIDTCLYSELARV
ncbi:MAG: hypothetical protein ABL863_11230, partial [Nitrosomonas sp.]